MNYKNVSNKDWKKYLFASSLTLMMAVAVPNANAQETTAGDTQPSTTNVPTINTNVVETSAVPVETAAAPVETTTAPVETTTTPVETTVETTEKATQPIESTNTVAKPLKAAATPVASVTGEKYTATEKTVYMTDVNKITLPSNLTPEQFNQYNWTFDGKPISEYMQWNMKTGKFDSTNPLVQVSQENGSIVITINPMFGDDDLSKRWPNNVRRTYQSYIGAHELKATDGTSGNEIIIPINYRPYQDFMTYDEMLKAVDKTVAEAATDRYVTVEVTGKSEQGRDLRQGIVAKSKSVVDDYLNNTVPLMLENPEKFIDMIKKGQIDYKVPIFFNNTHADEQPGIDIVRKAFETFAKENKITFDTKDANGNVITRELAMDNILDNAIFIFNFVENPDGYVANTRSNSEGFDVNRDSSYQTLPETRAVVEQINRFNPISFMDFHGFVEEFLIEPCTAPHDPNFEYDLLYNSMLEHAHAMGKAGTTNTIYGKRTDPDILEATHGKNYLIPALDWKSGWDDAFSGYTGVYAIYQGILGHTIEVPETNQHSLNAGLYASFGGIDYVLSHKDELMLNKLEIFKRGINKEENPATEKYFVDASGKVVGRPKGDKPKFFPDYYVIPMSIDRQKGPKAAFDMIEYLRRNGVKVTQLLEDTAGYKKGDLVVDMAQAKRGYANHVLYNGANESTFDAMYAELVVNFPEMRGFTSEAIYKDGLFANKLGEVTHTQAPRSTVDNSTYYIVDGNSLEATKAINKAIKDGHKVYKSKDGFYVEKSVFENLLKDYALVGKGVCGEPKGDVIKPVKVFAPGNPNYYLGFPGHTDSYWALKDMGFDVVESVEEADVVLIDNEDFDTAILGKKPTIIIGGGALGIVKETGLLKGLELGIENSSYEGLMKAKVDKSNILASGFAADDIFYSNSGTFLKQLPEGFKSLITISDAEDFFISGWWPNNAELKGKIVAADGTYNNMPMFIYAGNPTNKNHPEYLYQWVTNGIYRAEPNEFIAKDCPNCNIEPGNDVNPGKVAVVSAAEKSAELPQTGEKDLTVYGVISLLLGTGLFGFMKRNKQEN